MRNADLLEQFDAELPLSRAVLDAIPPAALDWVPHPRSFSLGRLAMHVATIPGWVPSFVRASLHDMGAGGPGPATPTSHSELLMAFDTAVDKGRLALQSLDDGALRERWSLVRHGEFIAEMTRGEAISRYVIRHAVHHRGQLTVYLRLLELAVPPLYGDSADLRLPPRGCAP